MTLRQKMLLKKLPENNYNVQKTGKLVGYSDYYANSRLHQTVRNCKAMKEYFNENTVKRDIRKVKKLVLKAKDYTNFLRATELESKILGMQLDKSEVLNKGASSVVVVDNSGRFNSDKIKIKSSSENEDKQENADCKDSVSK